MLEYTIFFLGIVGIIQMFILPGTIVLKCTGQSFPVFKWFAVVAAISLTLNYVLVSLLSVFNLMNTEWVRSWLVGECLLLLWLYRHSLSKSLKDLSTGYHFKRFWHWCSHGSHASVRVVFFVVSILMFFAFLAILHSHLGEIFHVDDEVHSWNRWALVWAGGKMPSTGLYPQLIPTNYALLYAIMGHLPGKAILVTFARSIMPIFSILCLMLGFDLLLKQQKERYLFAIPVLALVMLGMLGKYVPRGYVDIPLAFFAFTAIMYFQDAQFIKKKLSVPDLCVFAIICAGSGVVKQGGLYLTLFWPCVAIFNWRQEKLLSSSTYAYLLVYAIALLIVLPWYLIIQDFFAHGVNAFNVHHLSADMWQGRGESIWVVKLSTLLKRSWIIVILSILAVMDVFKHSSWRIPMLFTFPYVIIWAIASPDPRNIAFAIPMLAISSSGTLADYCMGSAGKLGGFVRLKNFKVVYCIGLVMIALLLASMSKKLQYQALLKQQNDAIVQYTGEPLPSEGHYYFFPS